MDKVRMMIRLPVDVAEFIAREAKENMTTRNAEILRSIKERILKSKTEKGDAQA